MAYDFTSSYYASLNQSFTVSCNNVQTFEDSQPEVCDIFLTRNLRDITLTVTAFFSIGKRTCVPVSGEIEQIWH